MNNFKQEKWKRKLGVCCSPVLFSTRSRMKTVNQVRQMRGFFRPVKF